MSHDYLDHRNNTSVSSRNNANEGPAPTHEMLREYLEQRMRRNEMLTAQMFARDEEDDKRQVQQKVSDEESLQHEAEPGQGTTTSLPAGVQYNADMNNGIIHEGVVLGKSTSFDVQMNTDININDHSALEKEQDVMEEMVDGSDKGTGIQRREEHDNLTVDKGQVTFEAEGNDSENSRCFSRRAHWPGYSSGVTIGRGYDLAHRGSKELILEELEEIGIDTSKFEGAIGLEGEKAKEWLESNNDDLPVITHDQQKQLFVKVYEQYEGYTKDLATKEDVTEAYGETEWDNLQLPIKEILIDLRYRGDYTPETREFLQEHVAKNDLEAFYKEIADKSNWGNVPEDRFNRRVEHLKAALNSPEEQVSETTNTSNTTTEVNSQPTEGLTYFYIVEKGKGNAMIASLFGITQSAIEEANADLHQKRGGKGYFYPEDKIIIPSPTKNKQLLISEATEKNEVAKEVDSSSDGMDWDKVLWAINPAAMIGYNIGEGIYNYFTSNNKEEENNTQKTEEQTTEQVLEQATQQDTQTTNYTEIASDVYNAMKGWGTNENQVYKSLAKLGREDEKISTFMKTYKELYGTNVVDHIKADFSNNIFGNQLDKALGFLNINLNEVAQETVETEQKSIYTNQRDNEFGESNVFSKYTKKIYGDIMCNVTTLAMQLKQLFPSEDILRTAAIKLLEDKGYTGSTESMKDDQIEDILMRIFQQLGDKYFEDELGITPSSNLGPHQWASALNHVGVMFTDYVGGKSVYYSVETKDAYNEKIKPGLLNGDAVMLSTKLTGGHIVYLKSIEDDGLIIHDPYGMRMPTGYVKNGSNVNAKKNKVTENNDTFVSRTKHNTKLQDEINNAISKEIEQNFGNNLGESNFFSWPEVQTYKIGKWINVLSKK